MTLELLSLEWVHPGLLLILGAWVLPLLKGRVKRFAMLLLPAAALALCVCLSWMPEDRYGVSFLGQPLVFVFHVDKLSLIFSYVFSLMAFLGMVYALHVKDDAQHVTALTYAGGALGVTFAGDFLSLYVFWELMAISSVLLVWLRREPSAVAAGFRYLLVHVFGGLILLAGIALYWSETGSFVFKSLGPFPTDAGWTMILAWSLILVAFLLNAAVPPLGAWLPDAYPEATVTGAVFMTAFTTKSAVFVLIRGFAGTDVLVWLGAAMAIYGVVYAVLENDARRLLAYHIISQVGYMVCAVGIGSDLAINGAAAHAFAHILYKALLFMGAGAVLQVTGLRKLSEMGGLYKTMPITLGLYMIGAFAISAVPLFSGFVSKSMIISAARDDHRQWIFLMLTLASAGTFLHTGLKLPYYMFFGKDSGVRGQEPPMNMLVAMGLAAAACVLIGVFPFLLYRLLPYSMADRGPYFLYTLPHVTASLGMLVFTALGFFLLLKHLDPERKISLDTDWFYRKGSSAVASVTQGPLARLESGFVGEIYEFVMRRLVLGTAGLLRKFDTFVIDSAAVSVGRLTQAFSEILKTTVSGNAQHYGLMMAAGVLALLALAMSAL
jgi:multicomponent Na+:H+ antiporter subunit D